jgi:hypothetical protein
VTAFFIAGVAHEPDRSRTLMSKSAAPSKPPPGVGSANGASSSWNCRRHGTDYETRVGRRDAVEGETVIAIFDLGAGAYAIRCAGRGQGRGEAPIVIDKRQVYSVTEFSA